MDVDDLDYLASEQTPLGLICLRQRGLPGDPKRRITEITLDHEFLMSSLATASEEALATRGVAFHGGSELDVLIGGLGLGYTARAALGCEAVARVEVVELLEPVIDWCERGLIPLAAELTAEPRLRVVQGDAYARLLAPTEEHFDLILVDVDHSPEESLGSSQHAFHSPQGLARARDHLRPGGVLAVWSYAKSPDFERAMAEVFETLRTEPVPFFNPAIGAEETNWLFLGRTGS
ncbi:MAG: spermidine synthase [Deltaproteobacteria bacterium]|jgi:spermidine synthase|nr:spermidine synthase [Deltaproteobacteria bacterium]